MEEEVDPLCAATAPSSGLTLHCIHGFVFGRHHNIALISCNGLGYLYWGEKKIHEMTDDCETKASALILNDCI